MKNSNIVTIKGFQGETDIIMSRLKYNGNLLDYLHLVDIDLFDYVQIGDLCVIVDDSGLLKSDHQFNDIAYMLTGRHLVGNCILLYDHEEEFRGLTDLEASVVTKLIDDYLHFEFDEGLLKTFLMLFKIDEAEYRTRLFG